MVGIDKRQSKGLRQKRAVSRAQISKGKRSKAGTPMRKALGAPLTGSAR